jgi:hypothetical protein
MFIGNQPLSFIYGITAEQAWRASARWHAHVLTPVESYVSPALIPPTSCTQLRLQFRMNPWVFSHTFTTLIYCIKSKVVITIIHPCMEVFLGPQEPHLERPHQGRSSKTREPKVRFLHQTHRWDRQSVRISFMLLQKSQKRSRCFDIFSYGK